MTNSLKKRILMILISVAMLLGMSPFLSGTAEIRAANGTIGTLNGTPYSSFANLTDALKSNYKKT